MHGSTKVAVVAVLSISFWDVAGLAALTTIPYTPPAAATPDERGWEAYEDAPVVDAATAKSINPTMDTPEGAVVRFLASRVRGDGEWKGAMVADPSDRTLRQLQQWEEWTLERFQLRARKAKDDGTAWIRVYFEISFNGRSDEGEYEFEVMREGDEWRVVSPPA